MGMTHDYETEMIEEETNIDVSVQVENQSVMAQEEMQAVAENKKKKGKKNTKFNKKQVKETVAQEMADAELSTTVIPQDAEIAPVIEKGAKVVKEEEVKEDKEIKEEEKVEKTEEVSDNVEVAEAPKKTRRPNRGSKAKGRKITRTTKKKAENEE